MNYFLIKALLLALSTNLILQCSVSAKGITNGNEAFFLLKALVDDNHAKAAQNLTKMFEVVQKVVNAICSKDPEVKLENDMKKVCNRCNFNEQKKSENKFSQDLTTEIRKHKREDDKTLTIELTNNKVFHDFAVCVSHLTWNVTQKGGEEVKKAEEKVLDKDKKEQITLKDLNALKEDWTKDEKQCKIAVHGLVDLHAYLHGHNHKIVGRSANIDKYGHKHARKSEVNKAKNAGNTEKIEQAGGVHQAKNVGKSGPAVGGLAKSLGIPEIGRKESEVHSIDAGNGGERRGARSSQAENHLKPQLKANSIALDVEEKNGKAAKTSSAAPPNIAAVGKIEAQVQKEEARVQEIEKIKEEMADGAEVLPDDNEQSESPKSEMDQIEEID